MLTSTRRVVLTITLLILASPVVGQKPPNQMSDSEFWKMISDFSEPDGFFQYENFVSNEDDYQAVLGVLKQRIKPGGVFVGVGPEQNFTYVTTFQPEIAFIIDIRRQNMLEHLLYKALFELSADRREFVSRLFSRRPPADIKKQATALTLFQPYEHTASDRQFYDANLSAVYDRLIKTHGFALSAEDKQAIAKIYTAFFQGGPQMDYRFNSYTAPTASASYTQLMDAADRDGRRWSYLETEENFQSIKEYQQKNLIVPLVGDFAGPKTIRAVAKYARDRNSVVSVFYTSNVDEYLFRDGSKDRFFANVATLPMNDSGAMIRAIGGPGAGIGTVELAPGKRWAALWCSLPEIVQAFEKGMIPARRDLDAKCQR
jgi:hypothetical protein